MGRMADARKRARRPGRKAGGTSPTPPASPDASTEHTTAAAGTVELPPSGLAADVLREEGSPPAGAEAVAAPGRFELPSSGLAADVLSRPEAAGVAAEPASGPGEATADEPSDVVPEGVIGGAQSLSFFAAPAREERAAAEATEHLATFVLDREEYGVDVRQVQEIRRVGEITSVPRAPEFVRGVINLRGRILPVLDLKRKLGLGDVALERSARIVVVRTAGRMLGLLVDGASQVLKVPVSRIEPPPEEVVERGGDYIRAVAKLDDRLIILIDLGRVLAHELREAPTAGA